MQIAGRLLSAGISGNDVALVVLWITCAYELRRAHIDLHLDHGFVLPAPGVRPVTRVRSSSPTSSTTARYARGSGCRSRSAVACRWVRLPPSCTPSAPAHTAIRGGPPLPSARDDTMSVSLERQAGSPVAKLLTRWRSGRCGSAHVEDDNHLLEVVGFHFESAGIRDHELAPGCLPTLDSEFVAWIADVGMNLVVLVAGDVKDDRLTTLDVDPFCVRVDLAVAERDVDGHGVCGLRGAWTLRRGTAGGYGGTRTRRGLAARGRGRWLAGTAGGQRDNRDHGQDNRARRSSIIHGNPCSCSTQDEPGEKLRRRREVAPACQLPGEGDHRG